MTLGFLLRNKIRRDKNGKEKKKKRKDEKGEVIKTREVEEKRAAV